jgi:hypothetical protein
MSDSAIKPPIGLKPQHIHEQDRMKDIMDAMQRYGDATKPIPANWVREYNEIAIRLIQCGGVVKAIDHV